MTPSDFIYSKTYKDCLDLGAAPGVAANYAASAARRYKRGQRGIDTINEMIKDCKKGLA